MQVLITHGHAARTRMYSLNRWQLAVLLMFVFSALLVLSGLIYHVVFVTAARESWPVVSRIVKLVGREEATQRDRFMRENLDAMARKVGEMQAKLLKLEAASERLFGMAGVKPEELRQIMSKPAGPAEADAGKGGPLVPAASPSMEQINGWVGALDEQADQHADAYTFIESRLLEKRLQALMIPNSRPVQGPISSGFGFRSDPFSGRAALHTGLDFPADIGTPIHAAAGGVVVASEFHPQYGHMIMLDHGRGLLTRYAHASKLLVHAGDLVKRGQRVALVGTSGRSTGPHLHFEVLVDGVPQNPAKFLALVDADVSKAIPTAFRQGDAPGR